MRQKNKTPSLPYSAINRSSISIQRSLKIECTGKNETESESKEIGTDTENFDSTITSIIPT